MTADHCRCPSPFYRTSDGTCTGCNRLPRAPFLTDADKVAQPIAFARLPQGEREGSSPRPAFPPAFPPEFWACGKCGRICPTEHAARNHWGCAPRECSQQGCGARIEPGSAYTVCRPCKHHLDEERERAAMGNAKQIPEADYQAEAVVHDSRFYFSLADLRDELPPDEWPERVWACRQHRLQLDAESALESAEEAVGPEEDVETYWDERAALLAFVRAWNEKQTCTWWEEDRTRVVVLDPEEKRRALEDLCDATS